MHAGETKIGISYAKLCQSVKPGNIILIADGAISIEVVEILSEKELKGELGRQGASLMCVGALHCPGLCWTLPSWSICFALCRQGAELTQAGTAQELQPSW
jgi:hypothetical protein